MIYLPNIKTVSEAEILFTEALIESVVKELVWESVPDIYKP